MHPFSRILVSLLVFAGLSTTVLAAATVLDWPTTGTEEIGAGARALYPGLEPSGLVWHSGRNQLMLVGDEGQLIAMDADGSDASMWTVSGDLEDITVVDPTSNYVYLADEDGYIKKYNLSTRTVTQTWSVSTWMPELDCDGDPDTTSTCGMEALTYADGYFYAGYQYTGKIFKLDLSGTTAVKMAEYTAYSATNRSISGLNYKDGYLYALYNDTLVVLDLSGNIKTAYNVPNSGQEGIAIGEDGNDDGDANIFIAEDGTGRIYSYDNFLIYGWTAPVVTDPDTDGDGVVDSLDCSDSDASVYTFATFYTDADSDDMGSDTSASLCAVSAPAGYSSNSNDTNDSIPNAGVEIAADGVDNDGDGSTDEHNTTEGNGLHPYYSTLNANVNSVGKISRYWGLRNGQVGVVYADGSVYRYQAFTGTTSSTTSLVSIYGTAYFTVTLNGSTVYMNGYTGNVESYTPNTRTEISNDRIDNDLDGLVDEHSTLLSNGLHPVYGSLDPTTSAKNKIIGFWGLKNGEMAVRYADWSVYRYQPFNVRTETFSSVTQVSGTAYLTVTLNGSSVTINGYNGLAR